MKSKPDNNRDSGSPQDSTAEFARLYQRVLRIGKRRSSLCMYRLFAWTVRTFVYPYFSLRSSGKEHLNLPGPLIIAPVHRSNLDVPLVAPLSKRHIRSLAKDSMFKGRFASWFSASIGAVPVRRGQADRQALEMTQQLLLDGEAVLVFPEGTRQHGREVESIFDGCAYLAAKCDAPVVPVGIAGTEEAMPSGVKMPRRKKVAVCVGEPMRFDAEAGVGISDAQTEDGKSGSRSTGGRMAGSAAGGRMADRASGGRMAARREFSEQLRRRLQELMDEAAKLSEQGKNS